jgi:aminoglycoside phosphotransferase (APT) family kinase protein
VICIADGNLKSDILGRRTQLVLRTAWLFFPEFVRVSCYRCLFKVGRYLYGREISTLVQRLPFGLYLKYCKRSQENEASALRMVERYTSTPAPLLVDVYKDEGNTVIIMTRVRGELLADVFHLMSYAERDQLADDLGSIVEQLRRIPNHSPYRFADTLGGPMVDHRVPGGIFGPFHTEADFGNHLCHDVVDPDLKKATTMVHAREHRSVFTHSDLHPINILIEGGRLAGIVDWECAGFKPEYWEFTKAMYGAWNRSEEEAVLRRAFGNLYSKELAVEQALWSVTPFGT